MLVRNYKGDIVFFDIAKYKNEKQLYSALWKLKYDKNIGHNNRDFNKELIALIIS